MGQICSNRDCWWILGEQCSPGGQVMILKWIPEFTGEERQGRSMVTDWSDS